jgi:transcriptional regulator with XRE-family HTH domain
MTPAQKEALTKRIARIVERAGGSSAVARRLGVTPPAVRAWTLGSTPYHQSLAALCEAFGVNLDWLLTGHGEEESTFSTHSNSLKDSPSLSVRETKAERLAEMIYELTAMAASSPSFLPLAIARTRELFEEFMHGIQSRANNHTADPVKYVASKRSKRLKS